MGRILPVPGGVAEFSASLSRRSIHRKRKCAVVTIIAHACLGYRRTSAHPTIVLGGVTEPGRSPGSAPPPLAPGFGRRPWGDFRDFGGRED